MDSARWYASIADANEPRWTQAFPRLFQASKKSGRSRTACWYASAAPWASPAANRADPCSKYNAASAVASELADETDPSTPSFMSRDERWPVRLRGDSGYTV